MKILVTGSEGYIGYQLVQVLHDRGHEVVGLDTGYYTDGMLYPASTPEGTTHIWKDIRHITREDLQGIDAVAHLAELSNDPLGQHNEANTFAINHEGTVRLAELAKESGVERFVYTSSCSVYGVQNGEPFKTESSPVHPLTAYAKCKVLVERDLAPMADDSFSPTFLRNATAYGPSPRQRFDIVLNNLTGHAWTTGEIRMRSDGTPWRPMVHVLDICQAIACTLEAPREAIHNEVFNVGNSEENYQVRDIVAVVAEAVPGCAVSMGSSDGDDRSYRARFDKIATQLPGFEAQYTLRDGAEQMVDIYRQIDMTADVFEYRAFTRLKQLKHLLHEGLIDPQFFWRHGIRHAGAVDDAVSAAKKAA
jgi:nucleoside-diphosphate-sugar epimerase